MVCWNIFRTPSLSNHKSKGPETLSEGSPPLTCHMPHVPCHVSNVTCHVPCAIFHVSRVTCNFFLIKKINKLLELTNGLSAWTNAFYGRDRQTDRHSTNMVPLWLNQPSKADSVTKKKKKKVECSRAIWWRVCYQRGLLRLVDIEIFCGQPTLGQAYGPSARYQHQIKQLMLVLCRGLRLFALCSVSQNT